MLEHYVRGPRALARIHRSPIRSHIERLVDRMRDQGYCHSTIYDYMLMAEHFGKWLATRRRRLRVLSDEAADAFIHRHLPNCSCRSPGPRRVDTARLVLAALVPTSSMATKSPSERLVEEYVEHLEHVCGAAPETQISRARYAREFLAAQAAKGRRGPRDWSIHDVMEFAMTFFRRCKRSSALTAASALRGFLRFMHSQGRCDGRLVSAVPHIPQRRQEGLPRIMTEEQLRRFLGSFDRASGIGRRDYAMALCMTELGLRVSEVVALRIDDIDWRNGTVRIRSSKGRRIRLLPLSPQLGRATAGYLKSGRPASSHRHVFLRHTFPVGHPAPRTLVRRAMCRGYVRSGFPDNWTGTHILRHTAATRLLRSGVSLKDIADLLGHRSIDTSAIYAKVDLPALAAVALPWPEVQQ